MTNSTRKWIRGALETLVHGGAAALVVGVSTWNIDITWAQWREIVFASFMGNGALRFVQYFVNNPIPPSGDTVAGILKDGSPAVGVPIISMNPLSKVQSITPVVEPPKP